MRHLLIPLLSALGFATPARPDDVSDLRDRALKAAAKDPADIQKFKRFTLKAKGTSRQTAESVAATFDLVAVYPGKLKATWEFGPAGNRQSQTDCGSDDRGWRQTSGFPPADLPGEELNDFRTDAHAVFASTLLVLTEPDTRLSAGGRSKVGDRPVIGLKLSRRPYPEVSLYFDEETYLLRKMSYRSRTNGVMVTKEMTYGGHQTVGGLTMATTQTTTFGGKEAFTWTEIAFGFPDKVDDQTFEKPK